jgi:hypothetical protein
MQSTVDITLPLGSLAKLRAKNTFKELLQEILMDNREKIGFSIQDYHAREKVRVVDFTGITALGEEGFKATVRYTLEQFSVCSAIDELDNTSMELIIRYNEHLNFLRITGEYMPEA